MPRCCNSSIQHLGIVHGAAWSDCPGLLIVLNAGKDILSSISTHPVQATRQTPRMNAANFHTAPYAEMQGSPDMQDIAGYAVPLFPIPVQLTPRI